MYSSWFDNDVNGEASQGMVFYPPESIRQSNLNSSSNMTANITQSVDVEDWKQSNPPLFQGSDVSHDTLNSNDCYFGIPTDSFQNASLYHLDSSNQARLQHPGLACISNDIIGSQTVAPPWIDPMLYSPEYEPSISPRVEMIPNPNLVKNILRMFSDPDPNIKPSL